MMVAELSYQFLVPVLQQLSHEIRAPHFQPSVAQKLVLQRALQLLDKELAYQAVEHPEIQEAVTRLLT